MHSQKDFLSGLSGDAPGLVSAFVVGPWELSSPFHSFADFDSATRCACLLMLVASLSSYLTAVTHLISLDQSARYFKSFLAHYSQLYFRHFD